VPLSCLLALLLYALRVLLEISLIKKVSFKPLERKIMGDRIRQYSRNISQVMGS
jgi:hypothetical protein